MTHLSTKERVEKEVKSQEELIEHMSEIDISLRILNDSIKTIATILTAILDALKPKK